MTMSLPNAHIITESHKVLFPSEDAQLRAEDAEMVTLKKLLFWFGTDRITLLLTLPNNMKW